MTHFIIDQGTTFSTSTTRSARARICFDKPINTAYKGSFGDRGSFEQACHPEREEGGILDGFDGGKLLLPVEITYEHCFAGSNASAWYEEYLDNPMVRLPGEFAESKRIVLPEAGGILGRGVHHCRTHQ